MLFNSIQFLIFFPVVTALYFALAHRFRWMLLLAASCFFYMAFVPAYILILGFTIVIDYFMGLLIESAVGHRRRMFLIFSLIANIGVLAVVKYFNFLSDNLTPLARWLGFAHSLPLLAMALPIGLSFHTFQAMSYTIEVYRGRQRAERHFGIYSLYVMFYPQLVAGPIERPQNLLHQFREYHAFEYDRVTDGLKQMAWGFFQKVLIADRLAVLVNEVYDHPRHQSGAALILASYAFAFQIFCDFAGYSNIAIGAAKVMGFKLMRNFNAPYFARSVGDFWKRWHISLSTWFRDYLYIPLGGNRVNWWRWNLNLLIVFLISGLWHGANWTYIVWGSLHGAFFVLGNWFAPLRRRLLQWVGVTEASQLLHAVEILLTFHLVTFAWIFFRASSVSDAWYIVTHLLSGVQLREWSVISRLGLSRFEVIVGLMAVLLMEVMHLIQSRRSITNMIRAYPYHVRWLAYYALLFAILFLGRFDSRQFIYFQF